MKFSKGLLKATRGPFIGKIFFPEAECDVVNRVQFRLVTWHGEESEQNWEQGGWWHFESVIWDSEGVHLYSEVTSIGAELVGSYSWPDVNEDLQERRTEELYEEDKAWDWVSEVLADPLGLETLSQDDVETSLEPFQSELTKQGVARKL